MTRIKLHAPNYETKNPFCTLNKLILYKSYFVPNEVYSANLGEKSSYYSTTGGGEEHNFYMPRSYGHPQGK